MDITDRAARPFLRWAGSKRQSLHALAAYWNPNCKRYIEPFVGSASLFFYLKPTRAVLSDINVDLVRTITAVQKNPVAVFNSLRPRPVRSTYYYSLRNRPERHAPAASAARFIYLNRFCFNGLYRTNLNGKFNVPFSGVRTGRKPSKQQLLDCANVLKTASVRQGDFEAIVREEATTGDFVYLDPPYVTRARRIFREYDATAFAMIDLHRLAVLLEELEARRVTFVLSYAYCPEALKLFRRWSCRKLFVQRNIAGFGGHRRVAAELVVSNARGA